MYIRILRRNSLTISRDILLATVDTEGHFRLSFRSDVCKFRLQVLIRIDTSRRERRENSGKEHLETKTDRREEKPCTANRPFAARKTERENEEKKRNNSRVHGKQRDAGCAVTRSEDTKKKGNNEREKREQEAGERKKSARTRRAGRWMPRA